MTSIEVDRCIAEAIDRLGTTLSVDRIIVDPVLNELYVKTCRALGLTDPVQTLNRRLMNLRKAAKLKRVGRSRRTTFPDEHEYRFASEIAARILERRLSNTLDDILCDPSTAEEFDKLAGEIAPGYSSLQYRWAALNLRKAKCLTPEILGQVVQSVEVTRYSVNQVDPTSIPPKQGLYIFYESKQTLYVGEASHLRNRLKKHLDHSDNKGLARWLWEKGPTQMFLELHVLSDETSTKTRRALETELIRSRRPLFNVQR